MTHLMKALFGEGSGPLRQKIVGLYAFLLLFNVAAWAWAFIAFHHYPLLMGTSLLAYSFGLRHAVDAYP
jgi:high-affinity nickel-transport protein